MVLLGVEPVRGRGVMFLFGIELVGRREDTPGIRRVFPLRRGGRRVRGFSDVGRRWEMTVRLPVVGPRRGAMSLGRALVPDTR